MREERQKKRRIERYTKTVKKRQINEKNIRLKEKRKMKMKKIKRILEKKSEWKKKGLGKDIKKWKEKKK